MYSQLYELSSYYPQFFITTAHKALWYAFFICIASEYTACQLNCHLKELRKNLSQCPSYMININRFFNQYNDNQ